ncbi:hypothetical protein D3C79_754190 [compost metagenome]
MRPLTTPETRTRFEHFMHGSMEHRRSGIESVIAIEHGEKKNSRMNRLQKITRLNRLNATGKPWIIW